MDPPLPPGPPPERKPDVEIPAKVEPTPAHKDPIMQRLEQDPEFLKLSKIDRYKRYLKEKEVSSGSDSEDGDEVNEEKHLEQMNGYKEKKVDTPVDWDDPSELMNREAQGKSYRKQRAAAKVTKSARKRFDQKNEEKRKKKFDAWFWSDQELYEQQQRQNGKI